MQFPDVSERALWLVVPLALASAVYLVSNQVHQLNTAATSPLPDEQPTAKKVDDDAEEHIPTEALKLLSDGYSFELRKAAFKIALSQTLKDAPKAKLLSDISGTDAERRTQAVQALEFLIHGPDENDSDFNSTRKLQQAQFQNLVTYRALVTALVNLLPLHAQSPTPLSFSHNSHPPSPIKPLHRPAIESIILTLILELLRGAKRSPVPPDGGVTTLLKAGVVKRWLNKYPFPCTLPLYSKLNFRRSDVAELLGDKAYAVDDMVMAELFRHLLQSPSAQRELRTAGLATRSSRIRERFRSDSLERYSREWNADQFRSVAEMGGAADNTASTGWRNFLPPRTDRYGIDLPRPRSGERSEEEERVRRRHREAIVVADPGRPVSSQNILQRINSSGPPRRGSNGDADDDNERQHNQEGRRENSPATDSDREEIASHLSFSVVDGSATPESMPSLVSANGERSAEYERARREELERRLGARQVGAEEAGPSLHSTTTAAAPQTTGELVEMAVRAREQSRARASQSGEHAGREAQNHDA